MIKDIIEQTIEKKCLLKKKDKLLLGISGGPDSICLLHAFAQLREKYKFYLIGAHFNHALRDQADSEEAFVKKTCSELKVKIISEKKDVKKFFSGDSLEQTARLLRFDFFSKCSRQTKIKKIVLAHHKDDLIETVLMRMIRGAGLKGLRGFLPKTKYKSLTIVRPLIGIRKDDIMQWLKKNEISYCVDESNFDEVFLRNRIRLKLIPLLKQLNPNIVDNLAKLADHIALDYDFIHNLAHKEFQSLKRKEARNTLGLDLKRLKQLQPAVINNVMMIAIEELKGNTRKIESRHLQEIKDLLINRPTGSTVDLPDLSVRKNDQCLQFFKT
ncbi:MAG: tRNA lysidine(34) synthetase TilS [Candidatus Omnitrophica bacterium]|nr:tRNA lysidine(34) synthetase TilS [Candidatus Omnitrophota bacterium]